MPLQKSKNDVAWEALFVERPILRDVDTTGVHSISASAINTRREARLMTKFDHKINLPTVFADNGLSILPDSRRSYLIGRFDCYEEVVSTPDVEIEEWRFPDWIQSLSWDDLYSESSCLLCAQHAGVLADVLDETSVALTVFGRMSTGGFDFSIHSNIEGERSQVTVAVDRAQCEIDGGFEGAECFGIVEVKNQEVTDFHIRQLYYPYRLWSGSLSKRVVPVFLTYSNEVFTFSIYEFADLRDYNSLRLLKRKRYQIVPNEIGMDDIRRAITETHTQADPVAVPFPQADRFERVIDMLARLHAAGGALSQDEITTNYAFDIRQTQYYTNAGRYLGLVERIEENGVTYSLSSLGRQLMRKAPRARNLDLVRLILSRRVFRDAVVQYLNNARPATRDEIVRLIGIAGIRVNETTANRRAQTVGGWVRWIIGITGDA
jgi:hypothetical protein